MGNESPSQRNNYIYSGENRDPPNHCMEDSMISIENIDDASSHEEEEGKMKVEGRLATSPSNISPPRAAGKECTNPRSLVWSMQWLLGDSDVSMCPVLY
jgi:hypothetical protein